jgi:hypothetical protein
VSIDTLKAEIKALPSEERRKLIAFMVVLEDQNRVNYAAKLARKIDDKSPERWLTAEQVEAELRLNEDSK